MAEWFAYCVLVPHTTAALITHRAPASERMFRLIRTWYDELPPDLKRRLNRGQDDPQVSNRFELVFAGNDSRFFAESAGNPDALRSTTLTHIHASEIAMWPGDVEEAIAGIMGALVPGGAFRLESTPRNAGSWAYQEWVRALEGESPWNPIFIPWWIDSANSLDPQRIDRRISPNPLGDSPYTEEETKGIVAYGWTPAQIAWRRLTKRNNRGAFVTEFPEDPMSGWLVRGRLVFDLDHVRAAFPEGADVSATQPRGWMRWKDPEPGHSYVVSVDPAEGVAGGDFTAIQVMDQLGEQVAEFAEQLRPHQTAALLKEFPYPIAALAIERNNHGGTLLELLRGSGLHLTYDLDGKPGLLTTTISKASRIAKLDRAFWDGGLKLHSPRLYNQLLQFKYDDHNRANGPDGGGDNVVQHDDLVSALMLVYTTMATGVEFASTPLQLKVLEAKGPKAQKMQPLGSVAPPAIKIPDSCPLCAGPLLKLRVAALDGCPFCGAPRSDSPQSYPADAPLMPSNIVSR